MLGSGKTGAVRALVTASSARSQDAGLYGRYAATLYRQALQTRRDPAWAERVAGDVIVNEAALARISERGEDDARPMAALWHAVRRRLASCGPRPANRTSSRHRPRSRLWTASA